MDGCAVSYRNPRRHRPRSPADDGPRSELTRYQAGELELVRRELTPVGQAGIDASLPSIPGMRAKPSYITFDDVVRMETEVSDD